MRSLGTALVLAGFSVFASTATMADPLPKGAKPASISKISKAYTGKTDLWNSGCNGGIYFSPDGQARAWCKDSSNSFGAGTWSIDVQGNLCQNLSWYWPNDDQIGKSPSDSNCIAHIQDRWGQLWRSWPGSDDWWPVDQYSGLVRGYKFKAEVMATRSQLGF
ncbi:DUF995 domain-containing protein [Roseobacter sp. SK209-2-6]|uniref:DUF995 domain-containing protein n=1 Tax=Roseobacter sp. SK209-2-6 TaxID=388739 RepID=UPI0018DCBB7C|nr:DUF995 domain-containing protein [Roseobacter sp. SK209-2-6]